MVRHGDGPMRVIAGAGTGKTQTLTHRFAYLVENGVREDRILCLTYNRKAARELERRILGHFAHGYRKPWVKTFHSFCLSLIQEWALIDQLPKVEVLEGQELRAFVTEVIDAIPDDELITYSGTLNKKKLASAIISFGSQVRDLLLSPEEVHAFVRQVEPTPGRLHDLALAHRIVAEAQTTRGFHDFASMGYEAVRRLEADPALLERTRKRFDHLLVDEFQDTNFGQFRLIQLLAGETGNVCVVGDENQAIYAFRGGQSRYINEFATYFPGATTYVLGTNYRSGQTILDAANAVIQVNEGSDPVVLRAIDDRQTRCRDAHSSRQSSARGRPYRADDPGDDPPAGISGAFCRHRHSSAQHRTKQRTNRASAGRSWHSLIGRGNPEAKTPKRSSTYSPHCD